MLICVYMSYVRKAWNYVVCIFDVCTKCFLEHEYMYDMLLETIWCYCMIMRCKSMIMKNEEMICIWKMMKMQSMLKWWCIVCYTVKESMKREWIDALSIGIWLRDWLTVFSSHRNRNVGSIVSLRYNVGDTVLLRWCRWSRVTEV